MYLENFSQALRGEVEAGALPYPIAVDVPVAWLALEDHAAAAVAALDRRDLAGRRLTIAGPRPLTGPELADVLGSVVGRPVTYQPVGQDDFQQMLQPYLGGPVAAAIAEMTTWAGGPGRHLLTPGTNARTALTALDVTPSDPANWARPAFSTPPAW